MNNTPRAGYTLPVFATAAALAALNHLQQKYFKNTVNIDLITPAEIIAIPIEQVAKISDNSALAITRSDPGDNLDLTVNTPVWALVELNPLEENKENFFLIKGGEGIGYHQDGTAAIYTYARQLLHHNLIPLIPSEKQIVVTIILPEGERLGLRTSNAAFGVVKGLSLLGTTGISQPLTAPGQLESYQEQLILKAEKFSDLVFCIGENGLDLAPQLGINPERLVKTANWLGSMLVIAALAKVRSILLFGYHGKLIKLAGGIFHTHHHLADGRLEIITAHCACLGIPTLMLEDIFACQTVEEAYQLLSNTDWLESVYSRISNTIDRRAQDYIYNHSEKKLLVGSILFDRQRKIIVKSSNAVPLLSQLC